MSQEELIRSIIADSNMEAGAEVVAVEDTATASSARTAKRKYLTWGIERTYWKKGIFNLVGVDEAGRGPLAGPVVAGAVIFSQETCEKFPKDLKGLTDSKQLSETEREDFFEAIKCHALAFGVGIVSPQVIDEINILRATMQAMTIAVEQVAQSLSALDMTPEVLLVDGNYFKTALPYEFRTIVDGDARSRSIAAASVIAKVTRDTIMKDLDQHFPKYNFKQHKGYATKEHRRAIREHGPSPIHRRSFLTGLQEESLFMFAKDFTEPFEAVLTQIAETETNQPIETDDSSGSEAVGGIRS